MITSLTMIAAFTFGFLLPVLLLWNRDRSGRKILVNEYYIQRDPVGADCAYRTRGVGPYPAGLPAYVDRISCDAARVDENQVHVTVIQGGLYHKMVVSDHLFRSMFETKIPKRAPLSPEALEARKPPPPEELVGALQDRIHTETGVTRPAKSHRVRKDEQ